MTAVSERESPGVLDEYRRTSFGWNMSRCPAWCNQEHLTEAIWFARNHFHRSDKIAVHLPAVPTTDTTLLRYDTDIEIYIEASGRAESKRWGPTINVDHPGNVEWEDTTQLHADQAEELARGLLDMARKLREGGTRAPWSG